MVGTSSWSRFATSALLAAAPGALAAQATWSQTSTTGGPPALRAAAAAYDLSRLRLVLFGGFDDLFAPCAATWEFDGRAWSDTAPAVSPPARIGHALVHDLARGRVVLFGGAGSVLGVPPLQDTWEFDGTTWTQRATAAAPCARFDHAMAYEHAAATALLFGGRTGIYAWLGDTWSWNGNAWTQVAATGPSPRAQHAMCHDLLRARTVLFGGATSVTHGDTWEWDGTAWTLVASTGPAPRWGHGLAFDLGRGVAVLHGGSHGGAETWEWDGATWNTGNAASSARVEHVMVFDAGLQRTTLFGGAAGLPPLGSDDVCTYGLPFAGSYGAYGASCAGSAGMPLLYEPNAIATGPLIGQTSTLQVAPSPWATFFVFGWSDAHDGSTPLPFDLAAYGMPGCTLLASRDVVTSAPSVAGAATLTVAVPHDPFLTGVRFFVQAFPVDPPATATGLLATNALAATVGRL